MARGSFGMRKSYQEATAHFPRSALARGPRLSVSSKLWDEAKPYQFRQLLALVQGYNLKLRGKE
jgi:hypothetical protein